MFMLSHAPCLQLWNVGAILNKDFLVILELWSLTLMENIKYCEICNKVRTTGSLGNSQGQGMKLLSLLNS